MTKILYILRPNTLSNTLPNTLWVTEVSTQHLKKN